MTARVRIVFLCLLGGTAPAWGQFAAAPLGDDALPDIVVTLWTNSTTLSHLERTEYDPAFENLTTPAPYPELHSAPWSAEQIRSCAFAQVDADDQTDWVLLVHHDPAGLSTVEHWEGDETSMVFQQVLFYGPAPPGQIVALTFGNLDGDNLPDILTIEDPTGYGPEILRHYEQGGSGWGAVADYPLGAATDHFRSLAVSDVDQDDKVDIILVRDDEPADVSAIDQYEFSDGKIEFVRNLVSEPRDTHRFQAVAIGRLNGTRRDLLVLDWFFYETVHQIQRWELTDDGLGLFQILRESIPPYERLIDIAFTGAGGAIGLAPPVGGPPSTEVPTVSEWGLIVLALATLAAGTLVLQHRRSNLASILARR